MKNHYLSRFFLSVFTVLMAVCFTNLTLQAQSNSRVTVNAPASVAGDYASLQAVFGPGITDPVTGPVVEVVDTSGATTTCFITDQDLTGSIALIDRGACGFVQKVQNAQTAGAIGVIVCNNLDTSPYMAGGLGGDDMGTVTIPSVMISYADCQTIRAELGNGLDATLSAEGIPPAAGEICVEAIEIGPGITTVDSITSGFGAVFANASNAVWYSYTPANDGVVTVRSCGLTDVDTRLVILGGVDCDLANLVVLATNDDCDFDNDNFASEVDFLGVAGTRYFVYFDDIWAYDGFEFEIVESALPEVNATFTVDMSAETVDPGGVTMAYGVNPDDQNFINLSDNGDGTWSGTISLTTLDTVGYFFANGPNPITDLESVPAECGISAGIVTVRTFVVTSIVDFAVDPVCYGTCAFNCPSDSPCDDPAPDVVFCDDFENGTDQWTLEGAWGLSTTQSNSGANSLTDSPGGNYLADQNISASMATGVDLSTSLDATLYFDAIYDIEGGNFDYCYVEASTDAGTTWTNVATFLGEGNLTPWVTYEYSLGGYVGNADVRVRFRFFSDGGYEVDGIYIDNFYITASDEDNSIPLILHTPPAFYESQLGDVTQVAEIIDISGLSTVELVYTVDDVAQAPIAGTDDGGNMWSFVVPAQEAGAQVDYAIRAVDASDNANEVTSATYSYIAGNHVFYDDGSVDFVNDIGAQAATEQAAAVRITIDGTTQIAYALIRNYTDTNRPNDSIDVHIWADDNGVPGADLIDPVTVFPEANLVNNSPMTRVDLRPFADQLTGAFGDVFVGFTTDSVAWVVQTTPAIANRTFSSADGTTWTAETDDFHFRLVTTSIIPADNSCDGATDISNQLGGGLDVVVNSGPYDNTNYTSDGDPEEGWDCFGEPDGFGGAPSLERTVWFTFTGDGETYFIEALGCGDDPIDFDDTQIAIYSGDCGSLTPVACSEDGPNAAEGFFPAGLEFPTEEGVTYYMFVDGFGPDFPADGEFCLEFTQLTVSAVTVTFNVDMEKVIAYGEVSPEGVHIAGNFQDPEWQPGDTPLTDNGDGTWSYSVEMLPGTEVQYKFLNGNEWGTDETGITEDCGIDGGSGSFNRLLVVGDEDIQTDFFCFNTCVTCDLVDVSEEELAAAVSIFPNPAKEILNIRFELPEATDNLHLRVINTLGQTVYATELGQVQAENYELNVSNYPTGAYMIQLIDGDTEVTKSVVIE